MTIDLGLTLGCTLVSVGISYAIWSSFRVWAFRQDLFAIRDNLWDLMRGKGTLDEPAHREFRAGVEALIRIAPMLSLFTLLKLIFDRGEMRSLLSDYSHAPEIDDARRALFLRTARYLLLESFSGLILSAVALVFGMAGSLKRAVAKRIAWLFDSRTIQTLDEHMAAA